jgi:hypothetical protein
MADVIALRPGLSGEQLCRVAPWAKDTVQARRCLALAASYDGGLRLEAARLGDVTLQIFGT